MPEIRRAKLLVGMLLVTFVAVACSMGPPATPQPTPADARCVPADGGTIGQLGLAINSGFSVRNVYYVRSNDYEHTLFLSGDLEGPGLDGTQDIGTWAIDLANGSDTFYEMNELASQVGGWIPGSFKHYSMTDDGAQLSAQCASVAGEPGPTSPAAS